MKKSIALILACVASCLTFFLLWKSGINWIIDAIAENTFLHNIVREDIFLYSVDSMLSLVIGYFLYKLFRRL